ncbi:MAG: dihydrolipoyl dehydrogenase, partial [Thermoleophilaceae bacterium]|nr:dihydrolipoyl dehydrogenase [Thermoleophilaceae bacterium]
MSDARFDLIVVGAGPGGYVAAIRAAQLGLSVAVVERDQVGGRCLNYACIPAKAVLRSADVLAEVQQAAGFGVVADGAAGATIDFPTVAKRRDRVVRTLTGGVKGLMTKNNITVLAGTASLAKTVAGTEPVVTVTGPEGKVDFTAGNVVLATGSNANPIMGVPFGGPVLDTAATWLLGERPSSLAVIGAGASGVEVASAFGRFGTAVTLIEALPQILPAEDSEISELAAKELAKQNIEIITSAQLTAITPAQASVTLTIAGEQRVFDAVCIAAGRAPDIAALELASSGVTLDANGQIAVNDHLRTANPNIFAIGDLVRGPALAHKASEEGIVAAEAAAGHPEPETVDHRFIPRATFCSPQVASIGLTEAQAVATGAQIAVGRFPLAAAGAATVYGDRTGMVKLIGDTTTGELLGAHIVGAKAADLIAELAVARAAQVGYADLARIVHPHPTLSEALLEAA